MMKTILTLLSLLVCGPAFGAEKNADVVGRFGFDWLKPEKAKCEAITDKAVAAFKSCEYMAKGATGSFSGEADYHKCSVGPRSEIMIYKTKERCAEELEIMKANGP